jgi:hypothetical protein
VSKPNRDRQWAHAPFFAAISLKKKKTRNGGFLFVRHATQPTSARRIVCLLLDCLYTIHHCDQLCVCVCCVQDRLSSETQQQLAQVCSLTHVGASLWTRTRASRVRLLECSQLSPVDCCPSLCLAGAEHAPDAAVHGVHGGGCRSHVSDFFTRLWSLNPLCRSFPELPLPMPPKKKHV